MDRKLDLESYSLRPPDSKEDRSQRAAFQMSTALSSIEHDLHPSTGDSDAARYLFLYFNK